MRKCRVCSKSYVINSKIAGCCSVNCFLIRRKKLSYKNIIKNKKKADIDKFMKEQLERALKK
jgi:hypothetical protein